MIISRMFRLTVFIVMMLAGITGLSTKSLAQILEEVEFTMEVPVELQKAMYKTLKDDIAPLKEQIHSSPWLSFAFVDLNYDKKDEILVNVMDEYILVDEYGNSFVHGFAQTSKGLIKIFKAPAQFLRLEPSFEGGLKKIHVYHRPNIKKPTIFVWDGERQYIEEPKEEKAR